jgi:hypothetical protein
MKNFRGVFAKFCGSNDFQDLLNYFTYEKSIEYVHSTVDRVHRRRLTGLWTSLNTGCWLPDRRLRLNRANRYLGFSSRPFIADPTAKAASARARGGASRPSAVAHRRSCFLELRWSVFDEVFSYGITVMRGTRLC